MSVRMTSPYFDEKRGLHIIEIYDGYKPNGKPNRSRVTARSKNECVRKAQDRYKEILNGTYRPGRKPTVESWLREWLDNIAPEGRTYRVMQNYHALANAHLVPALGGKRLDKLTPSDIRHMHNEVRGKGRAGSTVRHCHNLLSRALKDAVREGVVAANPCDMMDRPTAIMEESLSLSVPEAKAVIATAIGSDDIFATRWIAALLTGARQGELLGLTWDRVNLSEGTIRIDRQLDTMPAKHGCGALKNGVYPCKARWATYCPNLIIDMSGPEKIEHLTHGFVWRSPKTESSVRVIPIPNALREALVLHHRDTWQDNPWGLVWATHKGMPVGARSDSNRWKSLLEKAKVRRIKLHGARHTTVSLLLDAGVDPEIIRTIVGHSTIAATRGYMHADQATKRNAVELLSRELE